MMDFDLCFVAHAGDPFSVAPLCIVRCDQTGALSEISIGDLGAEPRRIVSYDLRTLIDACRLSQIDIPRSLIDVEDALRLLSGRPRSQGGERLWDFWTFADPTDSDPYDLSELKALVEGRAPLPTDRPRLLEMLLATAKTIRGVWHRVDHDLSQQREAERFYSIEFPVRQIFCSRQRNGIMINRSELLSLTNKASEEKYTAFREIAAVLGFSPSGLSFRNVGRYLTKTDAAYLAAYFTADQLEQHFKLAREKSIFADTFLRFIRAGRSLSVLRSIDSSSERVFPAFNCVGTVTARVLVADPQLQQLPKRFRSLLAAERGHRLWYFDYAQFEPGVLASLMAEPGFIALYESSDLYTMLSKSVFKTETQREMSKTIFLAYCYGMSAENISAIITAKQAGGDEDVTDAIMKFFKVMPSLLSYREEAQQELLREGFVSSPVGNRRYRTHKGQLSGAETRWALNQKIQGTASLIFKQAILDLAEWFGPECIVLPMHDALLMQFVEGQDPKTEVAEIMTRSFRVWCPNVVPRVVAGSFATG